MSTVDDLRVLEARMMQLARSNPGEAMFAIMEALIDVACGDNPALRDYKRKLIYIDILQKLAKRGVQ